MVLLPVGGIEDAAAEEHVVQHHQPTGSQPAHDLLVVRRVGRLVGVDERDVDDRLGVERAQCVQRGGDAQVDPVVDARPLPVRPADRGPLLADVAGEQAAAGGQAAGDAQGRVAGEDADLDGEAGAGQPGQHGEQRALVGGDLHVRGARGGLAGGGGQIAEDLVGRRVVTQQVLVHEGGGEIQGGAVDRGRPLDGEFLLGGEAHQVAGDDVLDPGQRLDVDRGGGQFQPVRGGREGAGAGGDGDRAAAVRGEGGGGLVAHVRNELLDVAGRAVGGDTSCGEGHRTPGSRILGSSGEDLRHFFDAGFWGRRAGVVKSV